MQNQEEVWIRDGTIILKRLQHGERWKLLTDAYVQQEGWKRMKKSFMLSAIMLLLC